MTEDRELRELVSRGLSAIKLVVDDKMSTLHRHEAVIEELRNKAEKHGRAIAVLEALEKSDAEEVTAKFLVERNRQDVEKTKSWNQVWIAIIAGLAGFLTSLIQLIMRFFE